MSPAELRLIDELDQWYRSNCDGSWEHHHGITLQTLDNPGWILTVDLEGTLLKDKSIVPISIGIHDNNTTSNEFFSVRIADHKFICAGSSLYRVLKGFLNWTRCD